MVLFNLCTISIINSARYEFIMKAIGIALDLGTSGFRGQAIDLSVKGEPRIIATAVSSRHPLPGANVIDHLHYAIEVGLDQAHDVIIRAVNKIIDHLRIDRTKIVRIAVCGNPIQLSLFQEIEIRDLAYAGQRKLQALGVVPPKRDAQIVSLTEIRGLCGPPEAQVIIPPAVRHEIGADALAMMIQTGMLEKDDIAICTDYGTNAEMALIYQGTVYTGSTAAGPALEGQHIEHGLLALPGAITNVNLVTGAMAHPPGGPTGSRPNNSGRYLETFILDQDMISRPGAVVDPVDGEILDTGQLAAVGITGTGVVALLAEGMRAALIKIPKIQTPDNAIHLQDGIRFTEKDLLEAGKAIGSVRAGHITLCQAAGISLDQVETAYMSGASGTYVDALKAQAIGMVPANLKRIYQVGNTSLAMARELVADENRLWEMKQVADQLRQHHCMFAASKTFQNIFILELSYWTEGMPMSMYQKYLKRYNIPPIPERPLTTPEVIKTVKRDIPEFGNLGLQIVTDIGEIKHIVFQGCLGDAACIWECPENALTLQEQDGEFRISIDLARCNGVACRRCERACKEKVFDLIALLTSDTD